MPVARRPVDGDTGLHQPIAESINIIDGECQMAKLPPA